MKKFGNVVIGSFYLLPFCAMNSFSKDAVNDESSAVLEEIIVTARKREESLQESPVAISAFSAESLREAGISNMRDLSGSVPGLNMSEQGTKSASIFIRGIGQKESNSALDPSVGVYVNGIYLSRTDSQLLDTVDTESIQVLRGPQGTLFGKNTTGGAILVSTKSPNTEAVSGSASTKLGNFGRRDAKVSVNLPLNDDSLSMRLSVNSVKRDGYLENTLDSRAFGDEDRLAAAARVLWEPGEVFSADLFTYFSKIKENGVALTCLFANPQANLAGQLTYPNASGTFTSFQSVCNQSEKLADDNKVAINGSLFQMTSELVGLSLSWDLEPFELKSITSIGRQHDIVLSDDADGTSIEAIQTGHRSLETYLEGSGIDFDEEERTQLSQEFNIVGSALDESLSYTIGLFYSTEKIDNTPYTQVVGPDTFSALSFADSLSTHQFLGTQSDLDTSTAAFFTQVTYDVNDLLQATIGARYTEESRKRDVSVYSVDLATFAQRVGATAISSPIDGLQFTDAQALLDAYQLVRTGAVTIPINPAPKTDGDDGTWSKFTPAMTLSFQNLENYLNIESLDHALGYVTYSKGFKAGGFEPKGSKLVSFDPEEVTNYEIGLKLDTFGNRLRINTAIYYMEYKDMQTRIAEAGEKISDLFLYLSNAGEATVKGYELEIYNQTTDNLSLMATFNYTKGEYKEFETPAVVNFQVTTVDRHKEPFGGSPERSGSLTASYNIDTDSVGVFVPRLSVVYRDELYIGMDYRSPEFEQSTLNSYTLINARLSWIPNDEWNITAYVDNLTDKDYFQGGYAVMDALGAATVVKAAPRTYGIEISKDFY